MLAIETQRESIIKEAVTKDYCPRRNSFYRKFLDDDGFWETAKYFMIPD